MASEKEDQRLISRETTDKDKPVENSVSRQIAGCCFALVCVLFETGAAGCNQALGDFIPDIQINFWRFVPQSLIAVPFIFIKGLNIRIGKKEALYTCILSLTYFCYNLTIYHAVIYIPVLTANSISVTAMLLSSLSADAISTKRCEVFKICAVVLCVVSVPLIIQPEFIFGEGVRLAVTHPLCGEPKNHDRNTTRLVNPSPTVVEAPEEATQGELILGYVLAAIGGVSLTCAIVVIKRFFTEGNLFVTGFWTGSIGMLGSLIGMLIYDSGSIDLVLPSSPTCWILFLGHCAFVGSFLYLDFLGSIYASPFLVSLIYALAPVTYGIEQFTLLRGINPGHENAAEIVGMLLVVMGSVGGPAYSLYRDIKQIKQKKSPEIQPVTQEGNVERSVG